MEDESLHDFAGRIIANLGAPLESLLFYPHPFSKGGVIIVFRDDVESTLELVSAVYGSNPPDLTLHCLRRSELFTLSLPGLFLLPDLYSEHLHLVYWLKHKGIVLYGADLRHEIQEPPDPKALLDLHIETCLHSVRTYRILQLLVDKDYLTLMNRLDQAIRYLMATALLTQDHWDVRMETLPARFNEAFADAQLKRICEDLASLQQLELEEEEASRAAAFEAVWLFECFIRRVRECVR